MDTKNNEEKNLGGLNLWNTLSRQKQPFSPIEPGKVKIYTCGPTVYSHAHIGNFRTYIFADVLKRTLRVTGHEVFSVENITDVGEPNEQGDDKVEEAARKSGKTAFEIARMYTAEFLADSQKLNIQEPDRWAHASAHIGEQISMIEELEDRGFTYTTSDGVYFDTSKSGNYGELARLDISGLKEGARVEINPEKRHATDFALWKFSTPGARQMEWESPWGIGFPGWHIECSAMSRKYLGFPFDIHTGGVDLIPIHHTNEIAQNEGVFAERTVNYWLHNEFITVDGQKMSKSLGNIYTVSDIVEKGFSPLDYRYFLLGTHYRQKANFTWEALEGAHHARSKLLRALREIKKVGSTNKEKITEFKTALSDDLNTPQALAVLWETLGNSSISPEDKLATTLEMDEVLGLGLNKATEVMELPQNIEELLKERELARKNKDFAESDRLRLVIEKSGYILRDTPDGPVLEQS